MRLGLFFFFFLQCFSMSIDACCYYSGSCLIPLSDILQRRTHVLGFLRGLSLQPVSATELRLIDLELGTHQPFHAAAPDGRLRQQTRHHLSSLFLTAPNCPASFHQCAQRRLLGHPTNTSQNVLLTISLAFVRNKGR